MVSFAPAQPAAMDARHAAARARVRARCAAASPAVPTGARNLAAVLDLGNAVYFTFRGRAYGVPPLPWAAGAALHALWTQALAYPSPLTAETQPAYYALIRQLPPLLWRYTRPVGAWRRLRRRLGLLRNPFRTASERELVELADFFLSRRMTSGVRFRPDALPAGT